ncbi:MAG: hypothetical protein B1H13_03575 [Desulfobacteraceae bacterium 4484_190.3]|nr:MAG: hypothetical protein B1H13_03575 [Desulfobacteraceae bacterium 4484_190.3]
MFPSFASSTRSALSSTISRVSDFFRRLNGKGGVGICPSRSLTGFSAMTEKSIHRHWKRTERKALISSIVKWKKNLLIRCSICGP